MQTINGRVAIIGNTYPVKELLKQLGGIWNRDRKAWMVPVANQDKAQKIVDSVPSRFAYRTKQIGVRCEDAPCCGCCGPQGDGDYYGRYYGD